MKIKTFQPFIISNNSEEVIKTFEALGFVKNHVKADANSGANPATSLKNPDGFKVNVAQSDNVPGDIQAIRVNVDDFEAACKELEGMGFRNAEGERIATSSSDKACMMVSPTGFMFIITKHIK